MKYCYKSYNGTIRPVMPIVLHNGDRNITYEVLVDSGADLCLFHAEVDEVLGLDIKKGKLRQVFEVGGKAANYYLHDVEIEVGGWKYKIEAGFMPDVGTHAMAYGLAGQRGFFQFFTVRFDYQREEIEIKVKEAR